jgi:hypothetical protein
MLASGRLPHQLILLLSNKNVVKVGRGVAADLKYLHAACCNASMGPFDGALDLGRFAKDRQFVTKANCSLSDLTAAVLQKRLSKNISARISSAWEDSELSNELLNYAALDAYASLLIYQHLARIELPRPLPTGTLEPRTPVILYHDDLSRIICRGYISPRISDPEHDGIKITAKRTVIEVTEVLIPGAVVSTHRKRPLQSFGPPVFPLVCLRSHLRVASTSSSNEMEIPTSSTAALGQPATLLGADTGIHIVEVYTTWSLSFTLSFVSSYLPLLFNPFPIPSTRTLTVYFICPLFHILCIMGLWNEHAIVLVPLLSILLIPTNLRRRTSSVTHICV